MGERIRCFMVEKSDVYQGCCIFYADAPCTIRGEKGHRAETVRAYQPGADSHFVLNDWRRVVLEDGSSACECGYVFKSDELVHSSARPLWRRVDSGELIYGDTPPGAMWYATWYEEDPNTPKGPDGRCLIVQCPGGEWFVDSRASNCDLPNDNEHRCWVRHGEPPNVTVDKAGLTCKAGAGSIWIRMGNPDSYHGFLRNGFLERC